MTDELIKKLRERGGQWPVAAADRIVELDKENDILLQEVEYLEMMRDDLQKAYDNAIAERAEMAMSCLSADGEAQRAWDAQKAAEAERDRLREAAIDLRDDMMERAEFRMDTISGEQYRIVNAGNSAWMGFCAALKGETP